MGVVDELIRAREAYERRDWVAAYGDLSHADADVMNADDFARPFSHATLDAACEDKEAGMYFFLCAYELLRRTGEDRYRDWAAVGQIPS